MSAASGHPAQRSQIGERSTNAVSHEEWMRKKEHSIKLKEALIVEAKKDILEQVRRHQQEEHIRKQEKHVLMLNWEERKRQEDEYRKMEQYRKAEDERLKKQIQQEAAYKVFKDWLKQSLLKQRDEHIEKRSRD